MAKMTTLRDLFEYECKEIHDAEQRFVEALPKFRDAATAPELKEVFSDEMDHTRNQVRRLENVFREMKMEPGREKCKGIVATIEETENLAKKGRDADVTDASLIASVQKIKHYEIATYGSLRHWAKQLGMDSVSKWLNETLEEEKETDRKLTNLAQQVNAMAAK